MNQNLIKLKELNPPIDVEVEGDYFLIKNMWEDSSFICRFHKDENLEYLSKIKLPANLSAIYHDDPQSLEYIFAPLNKNYGILPRKFNFYYRGISFNASFEPASESLKLLSQAIREVDESSESSYRNLTKFRDYYKKDSMPKYVQKYFEDKIPTCFWVRGEFDKIEGDFVGLSKHLNFYMNFYDRKSPQILIHEKELEKEDYKIPCYLNDSTFPQVINIGQIDPVILDLFQIANLTANVRLRFLFYFQVLEYCSYYHLNDELKKKLTNIIKRPDLLNNPSDYSKLIIEEFKDHFKQNDDSIKLEKLVVDHCSFADIKSELKENWEYFSKDIQFDGGFKITSIIKSENCIDNPPNGIIKSVKINVEKIRNVLVHIRESRENKVILPTTRNNNLIIPYLYLIKRIAEKVAIQYE